MKLINPILNHKEEKEYFDRCNIIFKRLPNGVTIISTPRIVNDTNETQLYYTFKSGSYNDPSGKEGIHHLFEHLILNLVDKHPSAVDNYRNAYTSHKNIVIEIKGTTNPKIRDYGLWPLIPFTSNILKNPIPDKNIEGMIKSEVGVVLNEIGEKKADPRYQHYKYLAEVLYHEKNPFRTNGLGTEESLRAIKIEDIIKVAKDVFVPQGLTISAMTEGRPSLPKEVLEVVESSIFDFPGKDKIVKTVDTDLEEKINPSLTPGKVYFKDNGINNKLVTVTFSWIFPSLDFTPHAFALGRLIPIINDTLFKFLRSRGMTYTSYCYKSDQKTYRVANMEITVPSSKTILKEVKESLYPLLLENVLQKISDQDLENINNKEDLIQKAVPMPARTRQSLLLFGLEQYGKVIDADAVKEMHKLITLDELRDWRDKFIENQPAIIVTGDLG